MCYRKLITNVPVNAIHGQSNLANRIIGSTSSANTIRESRSRGRLICQPCPPYPKSLHERLRTSQRIFLRFAGGAMLPLFLRSLCLACFFSCFVCLCVFGFGVLCFV